MSSDLLNAIIYKKLSSFASIHIKSRTYQKTNYLFLMNLLEKSENDLKIINFDPLFYRFYLSYKKSNTKYKLSSGFSFISSTESIQNIFSLINKNDNNLLIISLDLLPELS